ncbi:MAG: bifunctional acetate--CoA ligase family protein/GNAT family N-acetyltransferase [Rhodothermaceae bacterium]|nr:bifunctional acetate--CoA ligase family protein/GNAT family N-acetyltransferase [Rhodothermaceae bacterium]
MEATNSPSLAELTSKDPTHDVMGTKRRSLEPLFKPKHVAVIGASEKPGSVGRTLLSNLISSPFGGTVYPVNLKRQSVLGIKAYPSLRAVPAQVDLAVIATPAHTVPSIITECVERGVQGAIIISAGFKERGESGIALEKEVLDIARKGNMRLIGPNCLGVMNPPTGFNATFASSIANPGNVGFISQSGALCTSILDWSYKENVGFSSFVSIGSMLDVGWGDLIYYLGDDPNTKSIVIYMESIGDARSFMSAAREVALSKPIIVIKAGRTEAAAKAASSHTGSMTGSDDVLDAAFRRCGVLRVDRISDLFHMAEVLSKQPPTKGPKLTIVTNAGGPGVLATDALLTSGGELATLSDPIKKELDNVLPEHWSHGNPIDLIGDASPERYTDSLQVLQNDKETDGLLVVLSPQSMTNPTETASQLTGISKEFKKPIIASWMGGASVSKGLDMLNEAGIPTFAYPDTAARMFAYMWQHEYRLRTLYETPSLATAEGESSPEPEEASKIIETARNEGRTLLNEYESKLLLSAYGIPTVPTHLALSADDAVAKANEIGYPVVVKIHSNTITHKMDVGGVRLHLASEDDVREAYQTMEDNVRVKKGEGHFLGVTVQPMEKLDGYEVILGSTTDAQFGPVMMFGTGGSLVEVYQDSALGLPPLNTTLARRMIERTKIYTALQGVRGRTPVDIDALERLMVRFSQLVVEHPWIKEIEMNPLLASPERLLALDARVVLHPANMPPEDLPHTAIRPYPYQYITDWTLRSGQEVTFRPIRPEDEPLMVDLHKALSEESVYFRYFQSMSFEQRTSHNRLARLSFIDYDRDIALVLEAKNDEGNPAFIAVGRLSRYANSNDAELSLVVTDAYQRQGIGTELVSRLISIGQKEGLAHITASTLPQNHGMKNVFKKLGFTLNYIQDEGIVQATLSLNEPIHA